MIQAPGRHRASAQRLTSTPPTWNQAGVTNAYQWLRYGSAIGDATGETYTLTNRRQRKDHLVACHRHKTGNTRR